MSVDRPIVILATPRSGSSMTAGIFARHGVWLGNSWSEQPWNPKGVFENHAIGAELRRRHGRLTHFRTIATCEPRDGFRDAVVKILFNEGYAGGPWLFKMSALYRDAWHEFEPYFVGVCRENNVDSLLAKPGMIGSDGTNRAHAELVVERHVKIIDETCDPIVYTDEVVRGDYSSLAYAFEYCGLEFDSSIADEFVDPTLWHH